MRRATVICVTVGALGLAACTQTVTPTRVESSARATVDRGNLGVSPSTALLVPGQSERYVASAATVTWRVDDPAIASVAADGTLTAHAAGFTWLRAQGPEGRAAHPISVSTEPATLLSGNAWLEGCSADSPMTCSMLMKSAGSAAPVHLRYRVAQGQVVAEFTYGSEMNAGALVGDEVTPGQFRFAEPAPMAPAVSRGAGGCCASLSEITASMSAGRLTAGGFKSTSASHVLRFRIAAQ